MITQQECIPEGCVPSAAVAVFGRCLPRGCLPGGCLPRGCLPRGCMPRGRWCLPGECLTRGVSGWGVYTSPCGQTDTCKNITFPQLLLQMVKMPGYILMPIARYTVLKHPVHSLAPLLPYVDTRQVSLTVFSIIHGFLVP